MLETLKEARELITDQNNWVQGRFGEDEHGGALGIAQLNRACKFCLVGAIRHVQLDEYKVSAVKLALHDSIRDMPKEAGLSIAPIHFNDRRTHDEVLSLLDITIERLEKDGND